MNHTLQIALVTALLITAGSAFAQEAPVYHFGTHEARTNIIFVSEADIETIHGHTNRMEGTLQATDSELSTVGTLRIPVSSLDTGIDKRNEHLQGEVWLDAANHAFIELEVTSAKLRDGKIWDFQGNLTIKGKTKAIQGEAEVKMVPEELAQKFKLGKGSWVNVKTELDVSLSDFGIAVPDGVASKVNDTWHLTIDIWGTTEAPERS